MVSGVKPRFKILVSAIGGTKNFFNSKLYTYLVEMVSPFSSLSDLQEVDIELTRPK